MNEQIELHHGFKRITRKNWQSPDLPRLFTLMTEDAWVSQVLKPKLSLEVPEEVHILFEVARGSLVYGWYFYPLITLASEQLFRVAETSVKMRCDLSKIPTTSTDRKGSKRATNFATNIEALIKQGIIAPSDVIRWQAARKLRNLTSHPKFQRLIMPPGALRSLNRTAEAINRLYAQQKTTPSPTTPQSTPLDPSE